MPDETLQALVDLRAKVGEECPYVFIPARRWEYITKAKQAGTWRECQDLLNDLHPRLYVRQRRAGIAKHTYHDLRRTCITNWARHLPIHVVQKLAGHSDIKTTQQYYLSVQGDDLEKARQVQADLLAENATDKKLTNSAPKQPPGG